jgi:PAS domain S-box-containing protein
MTDKPTYEDLERRIEELEQAQSEHKKAEASLRESEEKYKLLAENSADIIYKINVETEKCTYASPTIERMLGYTVEETLTLEIQDLLTPESYTKQKEKLLKSLENSQYNSEMMELEVIHKAGHTWYLSVMCQSALPKL